MIETRIKILASLYTLLLMSSLISLLLFGGFQFSTPVAKGQAIKAVMIDVSQLNKSVKTPEKKSTQKKQTPQQKTEKKQPVKQEPIKKTPVKKDPPKKVVKKTPPIKKDPPRIVKNEPKVDTKAQELERQKQRERQKKLEEIRKKRVAAEEKRKREEQALKDLAAQTQKEVDDRQTTQQVSGSQQGTAQADERTQLMGQYQSAVIASVERQWNKPASANKNLLCHVKVRQIPGGGVVDATISSPCNANTIVKNSIIAAIKKADPLPYKGFEKVFSRTATFIFQPDD